MHPHYKHERNRLKPSILRAYKAGMSIRVIAVEIGKSYGFVHSIISESDVPFRARGSANGTRNLTK